MRIFAMVDEVSASGHRPPLPVCVGCRTRLDGVTRSPGLVHVCKYCAKVQVFGGDRQFRELTDEERQMLPAEILKEHEDTATRKSRSGWPVLRLESLRMLSPCTG
jgi:hypothetical protein